MESGKPKRNELEQHGALHIGALASHQRLDPLGQFQRPRRYFLAGHAALLCIVTNFAGPPQVAKARHAAIRPTRLFPHAAAVMRREEDRIQRTMPTASTRLSGRWGLLRGRAA